MARKSVNQRELARRYALSLWQALDGHNRIKAVEDFISFAKQLSDSDQSHRLFHGNLTANQQMVVVRALFPQAGLDKRVENFLLLLTQNKRLRFLSDIVAALTDKKHHEENIIMVKLTIAKSLSADERQQALSQIEGYFLAKPLITEIIDANLLAGYVIEAGSQRIDHSLKTKIEKLHNTMKGVI